MEVASCTALRSPSPPYLTGRVACAQAGPSSRMNVSHITLYGLEHNIIGSEMSRGEVGWSSEGEEEFGNGKGVLQLEDAIMAVICCNLLPITLRALILSFREAEMQSELPRGDPRKLHLMVNKSPRQSHADGSSRDFAITDHH